MPKAFAQFEIDLLKRAEFTQTATGVPASAGFTFRGEAPGDSGQGLFKNISLKTPGGTSRVPVFETDANLYVVEEHAATAAALNQTFGPGTYTVSLTVGGSPFNGGLDLPADAYPSAPTLAAGLWAHPLAVKAPITVNWSPWPGPRVDGDKIFLHIVADNIEVYSNDLEGDADNDTISEDTLPAGKTVTLQLEFRRLAVQNAGGLLPGFGRFAARTTATFTTTGDAPADTTAPTLSVVAPDVGQTNLFLTAPIVWQFSESMDPNFVAIHWSTNVTPGLVKFQWADQNRTLIASYTGNFPEGERIDWTLNAAGSEATFFRDSAGNRLAGAPISGFFWMPGVPANGCPGSSPIEAAKIGLIKEVHFGQTASSLPQLLATGAGRIFAFDGKPDPLATPVQRIVTLEFPAPPAPLPHKLNAFTYAAQGVAILTQTFNTPELLDTAYPPVTYALQERLTDVATIVGTALLQLTSDYPPIPQFVSVQFKDGQSITSGLHVTWVMPPLAAGDILSQFSVVSKEGTTDETVVFSAPDACANRLLSRTTTEIDVPAGLLATNVAYTLHLSHYRVITSGASLGTKHGVSALGRVTHYPLNGNIGITTNPPVAGIPLETDPPEVVNDAPLVVTGTANVPALLQVSTDLTSWFNLGVVKPQDGKLQGPVDTYGFDTAYYRWRPAASDQVPAPWSSGIAAETNSTLAVRQIVRTAGATLALTNAGWEYHLEIPPGAIIGFETITLRLAVPTNLPTGTHALAGVQVEPTGLQLLAPATLTLTHTDHTYPVGLAGMSWGWRGAELHLTPTATQNGSAVLSVRELAGYALAQLSAGAPAAWAAHPPTDLEDQGAQGLALIQVRRAGIAADPADADIDYLRAYFNERIAPGLQLAADNDDLLDRALAEFIDWRNWLNFQERLEVMSGELTRGFSLSGIALNRALERAARNCGNHDLDGLRKLVKWGQTVQLSPWNSTAVGAHRGQWQQQVEACASFEVDLQSELISRNQIGDGVTKVHGVLPIHYRLNAQNILESGFETGPLDIISSTWENVPSPCVYAGSHPTSGTGTADVNLQFNLRSRHRLKPNFAAIDVQIYPFIAEPKEHVTITCPFAPAVDLNLWSAGFGSAHAAEVEYFNDRLQQVFGVEHWNVVQAGALLLTKETTKNVVADLTFTETSHWQLLHRPR